MNRRDILKFGSMALAGSVINGLMGCNNQNFSASSATAGAGSTTDSSVGSTACGVIPSETAGPYPAHNGGSLPCP